MTEKVVTIEVPDGYEVDKEKSSFEKIVFRALPDKGLPKTWDELGLIHGYYTDGFSNVFPCNTPQSYTNKAYEGNRNTWPTREEAEASIALAQLCQLRDRYNGGWKPDWADDMTKSCINIISGRITKNPWDATQHVLAFKTPELRDEFMKNFADLIEKAKPLLG
jgi:hypothetical protein